MMKNSDEDDCWDCSRSGCLHDGGINLFSPAVDDDDGCNQLVGSEDECNG